MAMPWSFHTPTAHHNYQWEIPCALSPRSCPQPGRSCSAKGNDPAEAIRRRKQEWPLFAMGVTGLAQQTCQPHWQRWATRSEETNCIQEVQKCCKRSKKKKKNPPITSRLSLKHCHNSNIHTPKKKKTKAAYRFRFRWFSVGCCYVRT